LGARFSPLPYGVKVFDVDLEEIVPSMRRGAACRRGADYSDTWLRTGKRILKMDKLEISRWKLQNLKLDRHPQGRLVQFKIS
jgi:hypothetical protein